MRESPEIASIFGPTLAHAARRRQRHASGLHQLSIRRVTEAFRRLLV
jgi:hypothetical protein